METPHLFCRTNFTRIVQSLIEESVAIILFLGPKSSIGVAWLEGVIEMMEEVMRLRVCEFHDCSFFHSINNKHSLL